MMGMGRGARCLMACAAVACVVALGAVAKPAYAEDKNAPVYATTAPAKTFDDVPEDSPWYAAVSRVSSLKIMDGTTDTSFAPDEVATRGQIAMALWNMAGKPSVIAKAMTFTDVNEESAFSNAVRWASSVGVITSDNDAFRPDDEVTNEQVAVMLDNYARQVCGHKAKGSKEDLGDAYDVDDVASWAVGAYGWCVKRGILVAEDGALNPQAGVTRGRVAQALARLYDIVGSTTLRNEALRAYQAYLHALSDSKSIVVDCDGNGLPQADPEAPVSEDLLYAFAVGDFDSDAIPELLVCIREGAPDHLSALYVCKWSKSAGGLIKCAPTVRREVPVEMATFYGGGWIKVDDGSYLAASDGAATKLGGEEGCLLVPRTRINGQYALISYDAGDAKAEVTLSKTDYNRVMSELEAGGILDVELLQATNANIDSIK